MHPSGYQGSRFNTNKIAPSYGEATLLVETQGLGHVPRPPNFTIGN